MIKVHAAIITSFQYEVCDSRSNGTSARQVFFATSEEAIAFFHFLIWFTEMNSRWTFASKNEAKRISRGCHARSFNVLSFVANTFNRKIMHDEWSRVNSNQWFHLVVFSYIQAFHCLRPVLFELGTWHVWISASLSLASRMPPKGLWFRPFILRLQLLNGGFRRLDLLASHEMGRGLREA